MEQKSFDLALAKVDRGIEGLNVGLPMGFDRLVQYIPGIQQGTYYLLGSETSIGKSAMINHAFVYSPLEWLIANKDKTDTKIKIIYYSFEITKDIMLTKAIARKIFLDYGKLFDINYILSRGKNRIKTEDYELVCSYKDYFYELEEYLEIIDKPENPTGIYKNLWDISNQEGNWKETGNGLAYTPNDPNLYVIVVVDHLNIMRGERGFTKKENIAKLSSHMVHFRNKCNFIPVLVNQFNRDISSTGRVKIERLEPQLSDFKDSSDTQDDANIVLALFSPNRYELELYKGYNTKRFKDRIRFLHLLKSRDGNSDIAIGLHFLGEVGYFAELETPTEFVINPELYGKYC